MSAEEPIKLNASIDKSQAMIGERIRYTVTLDSPEGVDVTLTEIGAQLGPFEVEQSGAEPARSREHRMTALRWYLLAAYQAGSQTIPAPTATYRGPDGAAHEVKGRALTVTITSLLPSEWQTADIRDIKPPVRQIPWGLVIAALVGLSGVGAWVIVRRHRRAPAAPPLPPRPPHEVALEALECLQREALSASGRYEEYYVQLSAIIRQYVEGRFGLRAPEMTTEEFLLASTHSSVLVTSQRQLMREFLEHCDLVKFARYRPSTTEAERAFTAACRFVDETKAVEASVSVLRTA